MAINICIPTLSRYDLLAKEIKSIEAGSMRPDRYYIMDNGGRWDEVVKVDLPIDVMVIKPPRNVGLATSWNYFLKNVPEVRVICNDDLEFHEDTLANLVAAYDHNFIVYPGGAESLNSFSCFIIPDKIVEAVGYFDEELSPRYAYFEDNDYHRRMQFAGYEIKGAPNCNVSHVGSATLKGYTTFEKEEHHKKFRLAQANYKRKWGGLPGKEKYLTPYNRG